MSRVSLGMACTAEKVGNDRKRNLKATKRRIESKNENKVQNGKKMIKTRHLNKMYIYHNYITINVSNIYIWWIIIDLILFKLFGWIFTQFLSLYRSVALTFRSKVNEKHKRSKTKLNLDNWLFSSKKSLHCKELNSKQKTTITSPKTTRQ